MTCSPQPVPFARYLESTGTRDLTPRYKLHLALRNAVDPFNLLTIVGTSAISVADDAQSPYGPGFNGFAKNAGVAFTQELTSQFFGTFLIPSLAHQDPYYHRTPNASIRHRIWHAVYQVVWTVGDDGKPMFNYANVFGSIAEDAISDIYVPDRHIGPGASAARISIGLATGPTDNLITEFLPDVANKINFRVVFVQRIINRVAIGPNAGP